MLGAYDFHSPLTADLLIAEVAGGTFAFKNQVKPGSVKQLWEKLGLFIADTLKQQKGVLLPSLGTFRVGPVVGESAKKIRPCFTLLEARYGAVPQERLKFIVGGKAPIVQPNYGLLSTSAAVHRGAGQRLLAELLQRLGVHILSQRPIKVEFPCIGKLSTNRAGRMEFVYDALFSEYFERESTAVIREMHYSPADYDVQKGLQHVTLGDPPLIKSPRALSRPVSAVSGVSRRERVWQQVHAPYTGSLLDLFKRCKVADRTASGCVPRLHLEQWLQQDCRSSLALLSGAALMDLLDGHTYGKTSKQIMYKQFLDALDAALASEAGYQPQHQHQPQVHFAPPQPQRQPVGRGDPEQQQQQQQQQYWAPQHQQQQQQGREVDELRSEASAEDLVLRQQAPPSSSPPPPSEPESQAQYPHYCQNQLSPRSRADYDAFNKVHFQQLTSARGRKDAHRAVTPKVGEEPLNVQEYHAVRSASPRGRGQTPMQAWPEQQQQEQQQQAAVHGQQAPPRSYHHSPQVMHILHPGAHSPSPGLGIGAGAGLGPGFSRAPGPGQQGYDILAPPPLPAPRVEAHVDSPLSQYDISREQDPGVKARLKAEYATQLQEGWDKQIRERGELQEVLHDKEQRWPFGPTGVPMDKRPLSAISRPWAPVSPPLSPRRYNAFKPHA